MEQWRGGGRGEDAVTVRSSDLQNKETNSGGGRKTRRENEREGGGGCTEDGLKRKGKGSPIINGALLPKWGSVRGSDGDGRWVKDG